MNLENLPIIDWEQGEKLAGNNKQLAQDLLGMLVTNLAAELSAINDLHTEKKNPELLKHVHKLHGALCYCGLPRLKTIVARMEMLLKKNELNELSDLLAQLNAEAEQLLHISAKK